MSQVYSQSTATPTQPSQDARNLGINYASGTGVFKITSADGSALSSSNIGYVSIPSAVTPGTWITHELTSDYDFIDDNGASEIVGNNFGLPTGVAWTEDIPFFILAGHDSSDTNPEFFLCRIPQRGENAAEALIGAPDDSVADTQGSTWSFQNLTEADYAGQPVVCVGSIRMRMSASDDWTVQALDPASDGIGKFQENKEFTMPTGVFGASSGTHFLANGGTAPVFTNNNYYYSITREGFVFLNYDMNGDGGTDGSGVVSSLMSRPYQSSASIGTAGQFYGCAQRVISPGTGTDMSTTQNSTTQNASFLMIEQGAFLQNSNFSSGSRFVNGTMWFLADDA